MSIYGGLLVKAADRVCHGAYLFLRLKKSFGHTADFGKFEV